MLDKREEVGKEAEMERRRRGKKEEKREEGRIEGRGKREREKSFSYN